MLVAPIIMRSLRIMTVVFGVVPIHIGTNQIPIAPIHAQYVALIITGIAPILVMATVLSIRMRATVSNRINQQLLLYFTKIIAVNP